MKTTLSNFTFLSQGGILKEFNVAGKNIILGFTSEDSYTNVQHPYFGETIGRVANRISGAKINSLNGKSYSLAANSGPNTLHGGLEGWGKKEFQGEQVRRNGRDAVMFRYTSPDGEEGFPGTVEMRLWYFAESDNADGVEKSTLEIEYEAELVSNDVDETVVSLTNHSYFNIGDLPTIEGTVATLHTTLYQVQDGNNIPTGELSKYPGIGENKEFVLGQHAPFFDHCFVIDADVPNIPLDTRQRPMKRLCQFYHPSTKVHLEVLSTEPAFQFYTGDFVNVPAVQDSPARSLRSGFCVEASRFVNAVNQEKWREMVVLKKGQTWGSRTIYRAWMA